jgi:cytochrome c oxidase assembly factor CtaG
MAPLAFVRVPGGITDVVVLIVSVAVWIPYRRRAKRLADEGRALPRWRQASFASGLALLVVVLSGPADSLADKLLVAHMAEHLVIGDLAALALVLGLTGPMIAPLLRRRTLGRLRVFGHPAVALPLWAIDLYLWHIPFFYDAALNNDYIHILEHSCFLAAGIAMWMALLGPLPKPAWFSNLAKLGYIIAVRLIEGILGNAMLFAHTIFYPYYIPFDHARHLSPLQDQIDAGAVMMVEGSIVTILLFAWLFARAARESDERQELLDYALAHNLELDEARAARAVAAGRGEELRRRLEGRVS